MSRLSINNKGNNEVPDIYVTAEENPVKPQLGDEDCETDQSSPQMWPIGPARLVGRGKEGIK